MTGDDSWGGGWRDYALSATYTSLLLILIVMGILAGGYHPSAVTMLSGYFEESRRGRVIALHMVGGSIGFSMGPLLGGLIAETLGWRFAFVILSFPAIFAVPLILKKFVLIEKTAGIGYVAMFLDLDEPSLFQML